MQTFNTTLAADADAIAYLEQIIDIDGPEVILHEEVVLNGSGNFAGVAYTVSDEVADFIAECVRRSA